MVSSAAKTEQGALPIATCLLILTQVVVWLVVRRYLMPGNAWTDFALQPGTPSEVGLFVSPFVHLEAAHLGVNLAVLWLFGANLERAIGSFLFLSIYLGAAWFAALMQWAAFTSFHIQPDLGAQHAAVGSSGAIAGVLGASLVRFPGARLRLPLLSRATFPTTPILALWIGYTAIRALLSTLVGVSEGVGHWAHFAGFIFGLGMAQLLGLHQIAHREYLENVAREAEAAGNPARASQAWSALLALRPADLQVRVALISARLALGDTASARRLAREGIAALVRAGDRTRAMELFRLYSASLPDLDLPPGTRFRLGCWLAEAGENELAYAALRDSVREDGSAPGAAAALFRAGQVALERLRDPARAEEAWRRLLAQYPDSPWCDAAREALRKLARPE